MKSPVTQRWWPGFPLDEIEMFKIDRGQTRAPCCEFRPSQALDGQLPDAMNLVSIESLRDQGSSLVDQMRLALVPALLLILRSSVFLLFCFERVVARLACDANNSPYLKTHPGGVDAGLRGCS
jgi:hypothetical protein